VSPPLTGVHWFPVAHEEAEMPTIHSLDELIAHPLNSHLGVSREATVIQWLQYHCARYRTPPGSAVNGG
jgi:hypothetical protein